MANVYKNNSQRPIRGRDSATFGKAAVGAGIGAVIGAFLIPGVGAIIGGALGGGIGGYLGDQSDSKSGR